MARKINAFDFGADGSNNKRPGIHSKNNSSKNKNSKNYKKTYRGQGR
jgi:hypothetical protein